MFVRKRSGFTIVELLIVIVVIAILAAITIVAFRGIQERSKSSVVLNAVQLWEQTIQRAVVDGFNFADYGSTCLGAAASDFPAADGFGAGVCVTLNGNPIVSYTPSVLSGWPATTIRSNGLLPVTALTGSGLNVRARGVWVETVDPVQKSFYIGWAPQNAGSCAGGYAVVDGDSALSGAYCNKLVDY